MNWNIFKRLRDAEVYCVRLDDSLRTMIRRVYMAEERIELLVNQIKALNARIETQAKLLPDTQTRMEHNALFRRIDVLENSMKPAVIKTAAEKLTKAQAYRRDYYQKRKAAMAKLAELKRTTK